MREKSVLVGGVICTIKKSYKARALRLTLRNDGYLSLTLPFFVSYERGRIFLESKSKWIQEKIQTQTQRPQSLLHQGNVPEYQASRALVQTLVEKRLAYFQKFYGVSWKRVNIRNQKTRWGSCSRAGNLSFNYRLLFLPSHLSDYVIVHELCHLIEFNHSSRFWALVEEVLPNSSSLRRELRGL